MGIKDLEAEFAKPKAPRRSEQRRDLDYATVTRAKAARSLAAMARDKGLSAEQALALLRSQDYQCPVCLRFLAHPVMPVIESSMTTGEVRGILCTKCSESLWLLAADANRFARMLDFLNPRQLQAVREALAGAKG